MAHLIDKSAILAEIEKLVDKGKYHEEYDCAYRDGNNSALYALKGKINTLEVKEVDLNKEFEEFVVDNVFIADLVDLNAAREIAMHFFELGLKKESSMKAVLLSSHQEVERIDVGNLGELWCMAGNPNAEDLIKVICADGKTAYWCDSIEFIEE